MLTGPIKSRHLQCSGRNKSHRFILKCVRSCLFCGILAWTGFYRLHSFPVGLKYWLFEKKDRLYLHYTYTRLYSTVNDLWLYFQAAVSAQGHSLYGAYAGQLVVLRWSLAVHITFAVYFVQATFCVHTPRDQLECWMSTYPSPEEVFRKKVFFPLVFFLGEQKQKKSL